MDKGTKRKRDSSIPFLSYSAPGRKFAKFFTETSLDEIKETVRKRLELASVSDFTLFYDADKDTDISLENDDDFDVFEVRAHSSASSVHVVVKILSPPHAPAINVAGPSTTIRSSGSVAVDGGASGISPPQKKRKVDVGPSAKSASSAAKPTSSAEKPISSVPGPKKRKSIAAPIEGASVATAHPAPDATANEPETRGDGESVKKRRKKKNVERDAAEKPPPVPSTASEVPGPQSGEGLPGEPKKKKSKKVVEKDSANPPNPSTTGDIPGPEVTEGTRSKPKTKKVAEHGPDTPLPNPPIVETSSTDKPNASGPSTSNDIPGEQVVDGAQRKSKPKKRADQVPEAAPSKPATSKKSTRNSKKDNQTEDASTADGRSNKSVKFTFPKELAAVISAQSEPEAPSRQDLPPSEKVKKSKGKKKAVENVEDVESSEQIELQRSSVDPVSLKEFWKSKVPAVPVPPEPQHGPDNRIEPQPTKVAKKLAGGSKSSKQPVAADNPTTLTLCPVCETSPFHLRYRCPVVLAGPGRIRKRIAELQQDDETDHSKLIQELRTLAEKSQKTNKVKDLQNVNAHSSQLRADATEGAVSDLSGTVPGHKLAAASVSHRDEDDSDGSSDSGSTPLSRKKVAPQPADFSVDAELEAIIRGPVPSRLTVDDILTDEEEDEATESVVLENDDDDINFRRRSRQFDAVASSGEEDDDDEESISADPVAESEPPSVVNTSVRADSTHSAARSEPEPLVEVANPTSSPVIDGSLHAGSRRSSLRSQTEPLGAIAARQSVDIDLTGDTAVGDAMASDDAMFGLGLDNGAENPDSVIDSPRHSARSTPIPLTPKPTRVRNPAAVDELTQLLSDPISARPEDDPIQPAEDFPPTPVQPAKLSQPGTPSTPRMVQRMKDRNGKIPVKLSQLNLPFSLGSSPQIQAQATESAQNDSVAATQPAEDAVAEKTTTRRSTRLTPAASMASLPAEAEQPAKRRRAPNKTAEQRAQEAAAKLAAKEERERLRKEKAEAKAKEKAQAKAAGKNGKPAVKSIQDKHDCPVTDAGEASTPKMPSASSPALEGSVELPKAGPTHSRKPMSQDEWTVLKPTSPVEEETQESMHDELRTSSPSNGGDEAPLFFPAESQVPFPYSQWNSVPDFCPGSPKDSPKDSDDEEEEEVAAAMKSSQRPVNLSTGSYRRLTDIASQPTLFSATPTLRTTQAPPATFPSAKDKRDELYGKLPQDDDSDSDSSADDVPSHIPKSRRAGMVTRQR